MITHYLQTALRHYRRHKYTTIANILCLAFGMTCFLCAYSVFAYFASAESGFKNSPQTYLLKTQLIRSNDKDLPVIGVPYFIASEIKDKLIDLTDISLTTNLLGSLIPQRISADNKTFDTPQTMAADDAFFRIFDIPFISGDRHTALSTPNSIVISKNLAIRFFGSSDVLGKTLFFESGVSAIITGVTDALPEPTHLATWAGSDSDGKAYLDLVVSWPLYKQLSKQSAVLHGIKLPDDYDFLQSNPVPNTSVYLQKSSTLSLSTLNTRLRAIVEARTKGHDYNIGGDTLSYAVSVVPVQQGLSILADSTATILGLPLVTLLIIFGTVVLGVAIANYINLYTAQLVINRRETATQRLLGATRMQVIAQCLIETVIVCALAVSLALLFFQSLKPLISSSQLGFVKFNVIWLMGWRFGLCVLGLVIVVSLLASLYAIANVFHISPLESLQQRSGKSSQRRLTQLLVALQFATAGCMFVLLTVIYQERMDLRELALGTLKDPAVLITNDLNDSGVNYRTFVNQLSRHTNIKDVTLADGGLWGTGFSTLPSTISEKQEGARHIPVDIRRVWSNYYQFMNIPLLAGHTFLSEQDTVTPKLIAWKTDVDAIVDSNFISLLGCNDPQQLIGKQLMGRGGSMPSNIRIIGVVANSYQGLSGGHNEATIFFQGGGKPIIKLDKVHISEALTDIDATWKDLAPNTPIHRQFIDEYYAMNGGAGLFNLFTVLLSFLIVLAISIAIMGMIGMASHAIARRTREISIRKSLGASSNDIRKLLLRHFATPVAIATVLVAWPLGWLASRAFLSLFPYRVPIGALPFVFSLIITVGIALLAVSIQSNRAARLSPSQILRHE